MFKNVSSSITNITFSNDIKENDSLNIILKEYIYNGGGVATGDINNDGLSDLFFSGNEVSSRLYMNKGELKFEDITEEAGLINEGWATGAVIVDINGDRYKDIFVSQSSIGGLRESRNLLYINNQDNTFSEVGDQAGIAETNDATQGAFTDYDKDGDLDLFLITHEYDDFNPNMIRPRRTKGSSPNTDVLFRNDGMAEKGNYPIFTNVSEKAGIQYEGYGLGVIINDFNQDSWPDFYVSNDYISNDVLYVNNGDGTFTNKISSWIRHQAESSMGVDAADFNNDGWVDIMTVDMLMPENKHQKLMTGDIDYGRYKQLQNYGYEPQFLRNMLQIHRGLSPHGEPYFSEVGQYAGIYKTGWSWSPLFADFDNDGLKDIFVSNGFPKDVTNLDLLNYWTMQINNPNNDLKSYLDKIQEYMNDLEGLREENFLFHNEGNLIFTDSSRAWGMYEENTSNGAVYVDLDNDGDLDLVTNNLNEEADIYRNDLIRDQENILGHNFLKINLKGAGENRDGIGSKIWLYVNRRLQYLEHNPTRGYISAMNSTLHFGLGEQNKVDSLRVKWPSGIQQVVHSIKVNRTITLKEQEASIYENKKEIERQILFNEVSEELDITFNHDEKPYNDFRYSPLIPQKYSKLGPGITVGDLNMDDREDFFIGGAYRQSGKFFFQTAEGKFRSKPITDGDKKEEDMGVLFFDYDKDGDNDLYVVSGSSEYGPTSKYYQDRLYINDGKGNFERSNKVIPLTNSSGSCVVAADYDKDGDLDLFRGGRISLTLYPNSARSYLFENDNLFKDVTESVLGLSKIGLVSDAIWTDVNNDQWQDLIVVGEWMPITIFQNVKGSLKKKITLPYKGWWNSITAGDFDNDGDTDYVIGNLGMNSQYRGTKKEPMQIVYGDFNNDGYIDGIINVFKEGVNNIRKSFPVPPRDELIKQLSYFRKFYDDYDNYASASMEDILSHLKSEEYQILLSNETRSMYLENQSDFQFKASSLPYDAQLGPVFGMHPYDLNDDNNLDLIITGNNYNTEVMTGQYDAFNGLILLGDGDGNFEKSDLPETGFYVPADAKSLASMYKPNGEVMMLVARNDSTLLAFDATEYSKEKMIFKPNKNDAYAEIYYVNGQKRKVEFYYGSGYLSHSSRKLSVNNNVEYLVVYKYNGDARKIHF
ncbi:VCBS repeat-containing protein [Fodinibius roseus]|uniref:VCBS repeat-containing protein n=1 Tax=Fodinibius roseus TaxID=1194090 RepID=UPI00147B519E|nr:VCBS repeat-containing protein [Fodinibius roseus]